MRVKEEFAKLKEQDIYSLMLFALFKLREIPEYSSLSELAYLLDKESLLILCEYFGGLTLKIPTVEELESIVYSLLLFQYVDIDHMEYSDAIKLIGCDSFELRKVKTDYVKIREILKKYDFQRIKDE